MNSPSDLVRKLADARRDGASPAGGRDPLRFARALIGDLVDKNLWPVALLLCVAIVAIPVLMTRGAGSDGAAGAPAVAPQPDVSATKAVELIGPPTVRSRSGSQLNPFRRPKKKKEATAAAGSIAVGDGAAPAADAPSAATPSAGTPSGGTPSGGTPSGGTPSGGTPSTGTPSTEDTAPASAARAYYRTEVRWSEAENSSARPIAQLTPLGDGGERGALYLGASNLGYAMFLLSPNAQAEVSAEKQAGKVGCEDEPNCRIVGLKAGATQVIIVPSSDGSKAHRYHLEAVSVKRVVTSVAAARKMRAKEHSEGRAVLREMLSDPLTGQLLGTMRYDEASGLLVLVGDAKKTTK